MYLRTTKRKNKDGSVIAYYQLAHNERNPDTKKPVAKIIHNFGRADKLDQDSLTRLCRSIARVCGVQVVDPSDDVAESGKCDAMGWPKDLKWIKSLAFGVVLAAEALWEHLGIGKTLRDLCKAEQTQLLYERALLAMTANRLCQPESKLGVWDRWLDTVYMPSCSGLKLRQMYEAMDLFHRHAEKIEETIFFKTADLFNRDVDLIFYDTTTASFSIDYADEENGRIFGHAKEGVWAPQVVVALAVTRDGLPVRSWVFPGKTTDVSTIEKVRSDLRGWDLGRALFVADSGMNSDENRKELARACGKWVIQTNDDTISVEDAASGYKGLMIIERCFRSLKQTQIKMTPMYHWLSRRIETHVKICVLALLIERVAEITCKMPWAHIKKDLAKLEISEFLTPDHRCYKRNEISSSTRNILNLLKINAPKEVLAIEKRAEKQ